jgi:serine/threonine protein kinase
VSLSNVLRFHGRKPGEEAAGSLFVERYRLLQRLGRGGMGEVWRAADEKGPRVVALKLLHPRLLEVPGYRERFERECLALVTVESRYVVPVYDWGTEPQPFMVMKRIQGVTLREMLLEYRRLHWIAAACYMTHVAEGLATVHRLKVWHRDIKPENLMVDEEGDVTILDFGIARDAARPRTRPGEMTDRIGTLGYLPPEMARCEATDHRGDLYQLGVVLYELIAGRKPYAGFDETNETEMQAAHAHAPPDPIRDAPPDGMEPPDCPDVLEEIIMRLLAKKPAYRYQSGREVAAALAQVVKERGSLPAGHALEPMVHRALVRRKLSSLAAYQEAPPVEEPPVEEPPVEEPPVEEPPVEEPHVEEPQAAQEPARQERTEPLGGEVCPTIELGQGFVAPSPAHPSARPPAPVAIVAITMEEHQQTMPPPRSAPVMVAPFPLAQPKVTSTAAVERPPIPYEPFPITRPRKERGGVVAAGVAAMGVLGVLLLLGAGMVLTLMSRAPEEPAPIASAVPSASAAPSASASVSAAPPAATASAAPPRATPARRAAPARSAAPVKDTPRKLPQPELLF